MDGILQIRGSWNDLFGRFRKKEKQISVIVIESCLLLKWKTCVLTAYNDPSIYSRGFHIKTKVPQQKNSLEIPKELSESVNRERTDNTMLKEKGQTTIYKTYNRTQSISYKDEITTYMKALHTRRNTQLSLN
jgi:hypothetical protein